MPISRASTRAGTTPFIAVLVRCRRAHSTAQQSSLTAAHDRVALDPQIEDDNFDPKTGKQRQLWCLASSAKRYVLFLRDRNGGPELLRKGINKGDDDWSQHGVGHLLNRSGPPARIAAGSRRLGSASWADH